MAKSLVAGPAAHGITKVSVAIAKETSSSRLNAVMTMATI
jgi:hypothetical protein